ncbi:hypothetical protein VTJ04DRAFT_5557 [Mycothermus thermophilus]|uniref:uncharacterized protein n=1 Tax=Humicola insolens TaxID=85995 RepID=UPI00374351F0
MVKGGAWSKGVIGPPVTSSGGGRWESRWIDQMRALREKTKKRFARKTGQKRGRRRDDAFRQLAITSFARKLAASQSFRADRHKNTKLKEYMATPTAPLSSTKLDRPWAGILRKLCSRKE